MEQFSKEFIERAKIVTQEYGEFLDRSHFSMRKRCLDAYNKTEECKISQKKYSLTKKGKIAAKRRNATRVQRFRETTKNLSEEEQEAIKLFYVNCPEGYEVDHRIPIAKGGTHTLDNLQYLTREENRRKKDKIMEPLPSKPCSHCKKEKLLYEFNRCSRNRNGLTSWCKECTNIKRKSSVEGKPVLNVGAGFNKFHAKHPSKELMDKIRLEDVMEYENIINRNSKKKSSSC